MTYKSERLGIPQMFDELVEAGRSRHAAAIELGSALLDGVIPLEFAGKRVIEELAPIAQCLKDVAADPRFRPAGLAVARWLVVFGKAEALRALFESACGLSEVEDKVDGVPNRRFVSDDELVATALAGIRERKWPNAHKAALDLAHQAEGISFDSTVSRLGKKIRGAMS
ncbi:hypothetical protein [Bradyrhizobium diazoefficiens]|uniref:hypothetical protein n=1 Tax=Bradyrhizobium diazoefficiens TaxID=1355477 RepID=UPI00347A5A31